MTTHPVSRVTRAYSLPVSDFDHLKAFQRGLQHVSDTYANRPYKVTNSVALSGIVRHHELMAAVAARLDMDVTALVAGLYLGELSISEARS